VHEPVAVRQIGGIGRRGQVVDVREETLVVGFAGGESQAAVNRPGTRPGDLHHRDAVGSRDEEPALEGTPGIRPMDERLARLEVRRPRVVADRTLTPHLQPQVERGHEGIGIQESLLLADVSRQPAGLRVQPAIDQAPDLEEPLRCARGQDRRPLGHEHPLVAENDDLVDRLAEHARADRPVAAQQSLFPVLGLLRADEAARRSRDSGLPAQRWRCRRGRDMCVDEGAGRDAGGADDEQSETCWPSHSASTGVFSP
jgi:hypothetical protein